MILLGVVDELLASEQVRLALPDVSVFGTQGSTPVFSHANT
jgi:hypothetical protein